MNEGCPSVRLLRALAESTGPHAEIPTGLVRHVETCDSCRAILDRLARDGSGTGMTTVPDGEDDHGEAKPHIPGLVDLHEIGRGGSGVVYRAKREGLDVWAAVKVLAAGPRGSRGGRDRAVREAKAAARVRHPNVIRTFDVGLTAGEPYIVMEYFEGGSLHERLRGRPPLAPEHAARLVLVLAEAVAAIHAEGLIHRDLKPSNILLAGPADAHPWECSPIVADFGLAREYGGEWLTDPLLAPGTPGYMAPEQIRGDRASIGPATDVYALGAILFRLLAGRAPFAGATRIEVVEQTLKGDAPPVSLFVPGVPRALACITATCLRSRLHARYPSAQVVAQDLRRYLEGRPLMRRRRTTHTLVLATLLAASLIHGDGAPTIPASPDRSLHSSLLPALELARLSGLPEKTSLQELVAFEVPLREALERVRREEARSGKDLMLRFDHADLALGMGQIAGRRGEVAAQAELMAEAVQAAEPPDGHWEPGSRLKAARILIPLGRRLMSLGRTGPAIQAYERSRDLLLPVGESAEVRSVALEADLAIATIPEEVRGPGRAPSLQSVRSAIEAAVRDHPDNGHLLLQLGYAYEVEGRLDEAIETYRRRLRLPPFSEDDYTWRLLAQALRRSGAPPDSIQDECRIRERLTLARWLRSANGNDPDLKLRFQSWNHILREIEEATSRTKVDAASFGPRLHAALAAETSGGRSPVDGGRVAAACDELAAEYIARTSLVTETGEPRSDLGGLSSEAVRLFEIGLGLAERGDAVAARLTFAEALVTSATPRRREGDTRRALELCELARHIEATIPRRSGEALNSRARLLAGSWTQTAKALFGHADREDIRRALHAAQQCAQTAFNPGEDDLSPTTRYEFDRALERLAVFEQEGGDYATAAQVMARREPLWPEGSPELRRVREAIRAIDKKRRSHGVASVADAR